MPEIEFIENGHYYLCDGVIIPSVSDIVRFVLPNKYGNIPPEILNKKAEFGTHVHTAIELWEQGKNLEINVSELETICLLEYIKLKTENDIKVVEQEQIISYKGLYAGRFDMLAEINGELAIVDIKTTAKKDEESWAWQTSLYELALYGEIRGLKHFVVWLPKNKRGRLVEVPCKPQTELESAVIAFRKNNAEREV